MARFYINSDIEVGKCLSLNNELIQHIFALRIQHSDYIDLFNGNGNTYLCTITEITRKKVIVDVLKCILYDNKVSPKIELGLCIIANDKMDLTIQKAVELGVSQIIPLISERSQKFNSDKISRKIVHWQKIIISSCEQCGQNILPQIITPQPLEYFITNAQNSLKLILSPHNTTTKVNLQQKLQRVTLLVGPEGGFSTKEIELALSMEFLPIKLGDLILRAETAVISGLSYINLIFGTWI